MYYRVYFRDQSNHIIDVHPFECADDQSAAFIAERQQKAGPTSFGTKTG
jgi:hypothetical protein